VIKRRGAKAGHAGHQTFAAAGITGDQMVDDLAREDDPIGFPDLTIDLDAVSVARRSDFNQVRIVCADVVEGR